MSLSRTPGRGLWTRGLGVSLVHADFATLAADDEIRRGLLDGIERGLEDRQLELAAGTRTFAVRASGATVGVLAAVEDQPHAGEVSVLALAIAPKRRGHGFAARALLTAERRWLRAGASKILVRVPATNGRGLYFMLRCGFTPWPEQPEAGATWFGRRGARARSG